jgi:hypothetical protein
VGDLSARDRGSIASGDQVLPKKIAFDADHERPGSVGEGLTLNPPARTSRVAFSLQFPQPLYNHEKSVSIACIPLLRLLVGALLA